MQIKIKIFTFLGLVSSLHNMSYVNKKKSYEINNILNGIKNISHVSKVTDKSNLLAAKIDLDKAYDKLEWPFIKYTLVFYHLPPPIIELIMTCISSSSISILWNGVTSTTSRPSRGIRQGDPLSPYLFIIRQGDPLFLFFFF